MLSGVVVRLGRVHLYMTVVALTAMAMLWPNSRLSVSYDGSLQTHVALTAVQSSLERAAMGELRRKHSTLFDNAAVTSICRVFVPAQAVGAKRASDTTACRLLTAADQRSGCGSVCAWHLLPVSRPFVMMCHRDGLQVAPPAAAVRHAVLLRCVVRGVQNDSE